MQYIPPALASALAAALAHTDAKTHMIRQSFIQRIQNRKHTHRITRSTSVSPTVIQNRVDLHSKARRGSGRQSLSKPVHSTTTNTNQIGQTRVGTHGTKDTSSFGIVIEIIRLLLLRNTQSWSNRLQLNALRAKIGQRGAGVVLLLFAAIHFWFIVVGATAVTGIWLRLSALFLFIVVTVYK